MNSLIIICASVLGTMIILRLVFKERLLRLLDLVTEINTFHLNYHEPFEDQFLQTLNPLKELIITLDNFLKPFFWKESSREAMLLTFLRAMQVDKKIEDCIANHLGRAEGFKQISFISREAGMYYQTLVGRIIKSCVSQKVRDKFNAMVREDLKATTST